MNSVADGPEYFGRDLEAMSFAQRYHEWILDEFGSAIRGEVAEVGAGSGNVSMMLLKEASVRSLTSFEPSANMFPLLQTRLAHSPRAKAVNSFFGDAEEFKGTKFDTILYLNVLEHVPDDEAELRLVRESLQADGSLLVFVPAGPWLFSEFDRSIGHFRRYTRKDLLRKVENAGFVVDRCIHLDSLGVVPWFLVFVLLRRTLSGGNVALYDRFVVPWLSWLERRVRPWWGKNLLLVAKPKD
ncbi:MAG: methyltransferase domain-containing protein [Fibrobacteria bacterium]|nr:methyltransferase domain-containing protein [Fibrobacteria bacterium]